MTPPHLVFAISADYERRTGGWVYDQRLVDGLAAMGWRVNRLTLPAGFPDPDAAARAEATRLLAALADDTVLLVDQLCLGVMPELAAAQGQRLRLAMIVHHPLGLEGDRVAALAEPLIASEREALRHVALAIATSAATATLLQARFEVPAERLVVAEPGVDPKPLCPAPGVPPQRLLSVGAVVPRKDHGLLVEALAGLASRSWHLTIVGNLTRAADHVAGLQRAIAAAGLESRVTLTGELDDAALGAVWTAADLYVASSRLEGFGMALAEALARGLPVVTTDAGAVGGWIDRRAAIVVRSGDALALRGALASLLDDPAHARRLRAGAMDARARLPRWADTAAKVDQRLQELRR